MHWLVHTLRTYPELAVFLVLGLGYWIGNIKVGTFSLGAVTGTLLMGVLVGQLGIKISPDLKAVFFLMFLFAVGYSVGPQFFRGLKSDGLPQVFFAVIICVLCLAVTWVCAKLVRFLIPEPRPASSRGRRRYRLSSGWELTPSKISDFLMPR